jgi:hypothetical protein
MASTPIWATLVFFPADTVAALVRHSVEKMRISRTFSSPTNASEHMCVVFFQADTVKLVDSSKSTSVGMTNGKG